MAAARAQEGPPPAINGTAVRDGWVTVAPAEFQDAINNPLKGFRNYKENGYGLLERIYIKWSDVEVGADDIVERIIVHTNQITQINGKRFEDLNVKIVPRVFLDWNGTAGRQHWPADLHTFDYDSPEFQQRLRRLVAKLGEAWDNDPRIFAVQMGLIGYWGEHHSPAPTAAQRRLLTEAFQQAFKNKPVLVRHTDPEFMQAGFGIYYDTFAHISREPPGGAQSQFPWQATHVYPEIWKRAPIEGEVEYNWQKSRASTSKPLETYGYTPDETMKSPAYRRYMIDKIRRYQTSYLGWISSYNHTDREVLAGAAELQKAFGYRFVLDSASYPLAVQPGRGMTVKLTVRNTGSAPFYLDWPVAVALLDPATKKPVWSAPLAGVDIRKWLPGQDWDSAAFAYRRPAVAYKDEGLATLPADLKPGPYIVALALLDRQGGMMPSARFAIENYFRGGWHPLGFIGVGAAPQEVALKNVKFDSPAFDDSMHYKVPPKLLAVKTPPQPQMKAVTPWTPDPKVELINPWRYWTLEGAPEGTEKEIHTDSALAGSAGQRVIRVTGDFGRGSSLRYSLGKGIKLDPGRYRVAFRVRGTPGLSVGFELADSADFTSADGPRIVAKRESIPLSDQWQERSLEFEITTPFKDQTFLRFRLPRDVKGTFDLTDARLKVAQ
ncbi:MAG: DUF4832 domain-containing protein [Lacunisphaera sp.]|nr:DUF4832 domain-containing protein [Lacunisphaera sp.]